MISAGLFSSPLQQKEKVHMFRRTYLQELKQNVPFILTYFLISVFVLFIPYLVVLINDTMNTGNTAVSEMYLGYYPRNYYRFGLNPCSVLLFPVLAYVLGLIQFHFLTNKRAMDVFASLPVRRETAVTARIVAGISILEIPNIVCQTALFIANISVKGIHGYIVKEFLIVIFFSSVLLLIPYALTVFVSTLSGTITENILYPIVLMISPVLVYFFINMMLRDNLYGFSMGQENFRQLSFLFPYVIISDNQYLEGLTNALFQKENMNLQFRQLVMKMLPQFVVWFVLILVFLFVSVLLYKQRKSEIAGKRNASRLLNVIACLATMTMSGMCVYFLTSAMGELFYQLRFFFFILGTIIAFVIFQMVILHSIREMLKTYKTYLLGLPFYILLIVFMTTNGFGGYNELPNAENVTEVTVNYMGDEYYYTEGRYTPYTSESPEVIDQVIRFQQKAIETRNDEDSSYQGITLSYKMKDGATVNREYQRVSKESLWILNGLNDYADFKEYSNVAFRKNFSKYADEIVITDLFESRSTVLSSQQFDINAFQEALKKDVLEESYSQMKQPEAPAKGYLKLIRKDKEETIQISLKAHYKNTLNYLSGAGLLDLMKPDFEKIKEVTVINVNENWNAESILSYVGTDLRIGSQMFLPPRDIFLQNYTSVKESIASCYDESVVMTSYSDPQEIEQILGRCYNEYEIEKCEAVVFAAVQEEENIWCRNYVIPYR